MKQLTVTTSQQKAARAAGIAYLVIIVAGIFAQFFVRGTLIVPGDAAATADNILASESLFRTGIAADLVMIIADIVVGILFYVVLKPVNRALALLAAFLRLAQAAALGLNLLNLLFALQLLGGSSYLGVFGADQLHALGLLFLDAHALGYSLAMLFFGVHLAVLAYLLLKSGYVPRVLGFLLLLASFGYLAADTFAKVLLTNYGEYQAMFDTAVIMPAFIAELALALWLLLKGIRGQRQDDQAFAPPPVQLGTEA